MLERLLGGLLPTTDTTGPEHATDDVLDASATPDIRPGQLAWRILTSPRTFMALAAVVAGLAFVGAIVPQGGDVEALLPHYPFHLAELLARMGLNDVLTSWPFLLSLLLLVLNTLGLALRWGWLPSQGAAEPGDGPHIEVERGQADVGTDALVHRLAHAGGFGKPKRTGKTLVAKRGMQTEGWVLIAAGAVAFIAALVAARSGDMTLRIQSNPGAMSPELSAEVTSVMDGGVWIDRVLPFRVTCGRADPMDAAARMPCVFGDDQRTESFTLTPGKTATVGGLTLRPSRLTPLVPSGSGNVELLVKTTPEAPPLLLGSQPGTTVNVTSTGHELTVLSGPDGPLIVARHAGAAPVLLAPAPDGVERALGVDAAGASGGMSFQAVPARRLTILASTGRERFLLWAGLALVLIGLTLLVAVPALSVRMRDVTAETSTVEVTSLNRAGVARSLAAALTVPTDGRNSGGVS